MSKSKTTKLHYDKAKLEREYENTFDLMGKALIALVGAALLYFFVMMVFLGHTHTSHTDFYKQFNDRITIEYTGQKMPMYEEGQ